jgi:hypothetical protein
MEPGQRRCCVRRVTLGIVLARFRDTPDEEVPAAPVARRQPSRQACCRRAGAPYRSVGSPWAYYGSACERDTSRRRASGQAGSSCRSSSVSAMNLACCAPGVICGVGNAKAAAGEVARQELPSRAGVFAASCQRVAKSGSCLVRPPPRWGWCPRRIARLWPRQDARATPRLNPSSGPPAPSADRPPPSCRPGWSAPVSRGPVDRPARP